MNYSYSVESLEFLSQQKISDFDFQKIISDPSFFRLPESMTNKGHSKLIDRILGLKVLKTEQRLLQKYKAFYRSEEDGEKKHYIGTEAWIGLHPQTLLTPYSEILHILELLKPFKPATVADFGCAYGRIGLVLNSIFDNCLFTGYEIVKSRVKEGNRVYKSLGLTQHQILEENILDESFVFPKASVYFIYDFSRVEHLRIILNKLESLIGTHDFVLVARGDEVRSLVQLYYPMFYTRHAPIHRREYSLYITHPEK